HSETVDGVSADGKALLFNGRAEASGYYSFSPLKATSGANSGLSMHVKSHIQIAGANANIELVQPFPFTVNVGDTFLMTEACDRTWGGLTGCKHHLNTIRFGGFPQVPGNRKTTAPGIGVTGSDKPWWEL